MVQGNDAFVEASSRCQSFASGQQAANSSDLRMPDGLGGQDGPAGHQDHELQHLGPDHRPQAAGDRVNARQQGQRDDRLPNLDAGNERVDGQGAEEEHGGDLDENVGQEDEHAIDGRAAPPNRRSRNSGMV